MLLVNMAFSLWACGAPVIKMETAIRKTMIKRIILTLWEFTLWGCHLREVKNTEFCLLYQNKVLKLKYFFFNTSETSEIVSLERHNV